MLAHSTTRTWRQWSRTRAILEQLHERHPDAVLVHGDAKDGDQQIAGIWRSLGGQDLPVPAKWGECDPENDVACRRPHRRKRYDQSEYCPTAGLRRNTVMVEMAPDLVLAFIRNKSNGAIDCARKAAEAGLRVVPPYTDEEAR
jgi:hypothetical protein